MRPPFSTSTNGSDSAAHPTANSALAVNQHSAVSASGKSDSADEGGGGGAADNRLGGRTLQMLLHSLGEDARKFYDIDDSTPDRSKQSPNVSPFMATGAASESVQQTNISGQPLLTPSTLQDHPSSVTALTPVQSFFRGEAEGSAGNSSNALALTAADSEVGFLGILSSSAPYLDAEQMLVLEVCEETNMSKYVYDAAISKGVSHQLLLDARWNLVCGIQCSYVGQLINYLEQLASLNANGSSLESSAIGNKAVRIGKNVISAQSLHALQGGDAAAWENCLRNVADGVSLLWSCDNLPAKKRNVPFLIRALKLGAYSSASPAEGSSAAADDSVAIVPSKLFQWIAMAERAPGMVSEWSLFAVFVEEACSQVQRVVDGLFAKGSNSCSRSTSQARGVLNATTALLSDPALLNLTLQLFHSTGKCPRNVIYIEYFFIDVYFYLIKYTEIGVLVGMALRAGAPVFFPLPSVFYAILSNSPHVAVGEKKIAAGTGSACHNDVHLCADVTLALALSLRNGIISTFPEVCGTISYVIFGKKKMHCCTQMFSLCLYFICQIELLYLNIC